MMFYIKRAFTKCIFDNYGEKCFVLKNTAAPLANLRPPLTGLP